MQKNFQHSIVNRAAQISLHVTIKLSLKFLLHVQSFWHSPKWQFWSHSKAHRQEFKAWFSSHMKCFIDFLLYIETYHYPFLFLIAFSTYQIYICIHMKYVLLVLWFIIIHLFYHIEHFQIYIFFYWDCVFYQMNL